MNDNYQQQDHDILTEGGQSLAKRKKETASQKRKSSQTPNERIVKQQLLQSTLEQEQSMTEKQELDCVNKDHQNPKENQITECQQDQIKQQLVQTGIKCTKVKQNRVDAKSNNDRQMRQQKHILSGNEKFVIEQKVSIWQAKQELMQQHRDRMIKKKIAQEQQHSLKFKLMQILTCKVCASKKEVTVNQKEIRRQKLITKKSEGNPEIIAALERDYEIQKFLSQPSEEEIKISRAKQLWQIVRRKRKVIRMMGRLGFNKVLELNTRKKEKQKNEDDADSGEQKKISRFVIPPNNYWNMQWNNSTQIFFVVYIFLFPLLISKDTELPKEDEQKLLIFDSIFMIDRFLDLLVGYANPDGTMEHRLYMVIWNNLTSKVFIEMMISFGPMYLIYNGIRNTMYYSFFKLPRYGRIVEMQNQIGEILEFYGSSKTVFEIKQLEHQLAIFQFSLQTAINLHLLTCMMIILCIHRNYEESWMYGQGVDQTDFQGQYTIAIYFVTTTLSTCGFGDISATSRDPVESAAITVLQFVGMLFYSMTIQKIQSFLVSEDLAPSEYANHMVEVLENLIVRVGRQLPPEKKITAEVIEDWRLLTQGHFRTSPNAFLIDTPYYQNLSSHIQVRTVKDNLLNDFFNKFEVLFLEPEFGFKADDKLRSQLAASLTFYYLDFDYDNQNILKLDLVSDGIYLLFEGDIDLHYKNIDVPLLRFNEGTYFGDISYILKVKNQYQFRLKRGQTDQKVFCLFHKYLTDIFDQYPDFQDTLRIRALRRARYFRKLRHQQKALLKIKGDIVERPGDFNSSLIGQKLINIKKVRQVESNLTYEQLSLIDQFSDNEITFSLGRDLIKEKKAKQCLKKVKKLDDVLKNFKNNSIDMMLSVVDTIKTIDDNSKKMVFKNFEHDRVNHLNTKLPLIMHQVNQIAKGSLKDKDIGIPSDDYCSNCSGNSSENDEMNQIFNVRKQLIEGEAVSECESCDLNEENVKPLVFPINLGGRKQQVILQQQESIEEEQNSFQTDMSMESPRPPSDRQELTTQVQQTLQPEEPKMEGIEIGAIRSLRDEDLDVDDEFDRDDDEIDNMDEGSFIRDEVQVNPENVQIELEENKEQNQILVQNSSPVNERQSPLGDQNNEFLYDELLNQENTNLIHKSRAEQHKDLQQNNKTQSMRQLGGLDKQSNPILNNDENSIDVDDNPRSELLHEQAVVIKKTNKKSARGKQKSDV